jgi:hypothetical protein
MRNVTLRWAAFHPVGAGLRRRVKSLQAIQPAQWPQQRIRDMYGWYAQASTLGKRMPSFTRKQKFFFGVALALWPVLIVALVPSESLIHDSILCISAMLSEAAASVLFLRLRRRRKDRLAFWSTIAAAVTGEVTLAFLIAIVVIATHT